MATISTPTFLDGGTARTAGESWTINNGGSLTIRSDTRWHANAPASMTGTIGINSAVNAKASLLVEGRNVRWMAYDTGTGNVPAIGTTITQGGVSGYLLGVWSSITSAPTAVGAAMPATGFLKFRSVTAGPFVAGALTSIGASATSADVPGWIEVVFDSNTQFTAYSNLATIEVKGEWFYLDDTTGVRGQTISTPINGGGAESPMIGVQIETAPGSGVYEWWAGVDTAFWTNATWKPAADSRSRIYGALASGVVQLGHNGTSDTGHVPPAGCKVRIANIIFRMALAASRASNSTVSTSLPSNSRFNAASGSGTFDVDKATFVFGFDPMGGNIVNIANSAFNGMRASGVVTSLTITNCVRGRMNTGYGSGNSVDVSAGLGSTTITGFRVVAGTSSDAPASFSIPNANVTGLELCDLMVSNTTPTSQNWNAPYSTFTNTVLIGYNLSLNGQNTTFINTDYVEKLSGPTTTTGSTSVFTFLGNYHKIDGLSWGRSGALSNVHPLASTAIVNFQSGFGTQVRNIGSSTAPLDCGVTTTTYPYAIVYFASNIGNPSFATKIQRCYVANVRNFLTNVADKTCKNVLIESVYGVVLNTINAVSMGRDVQLRDMYYRRAYGVTSFGTSASSGTWFQDMHLTTTTGQIAFFANPPTTTSAFVETSFSAGSGFDAGSTCYLAVSGDYASFESHWIYGHTRLASNAAGSASSAITDGSTASITRQYQIDKGSGWSAWITLTTANLFNEGVLSGPFRLKIKGTATTGSTTAQIGKILIPTATTGSIVSAPYPLDTNTLTFTGLVAGSEVRCYTGSDPATAVEVGGTESSGTSFSFSHSSGGVVGYIRIFALGYQPVNYDPYTFAAADTSILIQQTVDRNYVNP